MIRVLACAWLLAACDAGQPTVATLVSGAPSALALPEVDGSDVLEVTALAREDGFGALIVWADAETADLGEGRLSVPEQADVARLELPVDMQDPDESRPTEPWLTIVRVPAPWFATRGLVVSRFHAAVPEYEALDGLVHKSFLWTDGRWLGGVYRWTDPASARAFYDDAWHADIEERYGEPAWLEQWHAVEPAWAGGRGDGR